MSEGGLGVAFGVGDVVVTAHYLPFIHFPFLLFEPALLRVVLQSLHKCNATRYSVIIVAAECFEICISGGVGKSRGFEVGSE